MASIKLDQLCLDYIVKTGSESIKKTAFHLANKCLGRSKQDSCKIFHSHYRALKELTLEIKTGDRIGILGRNGAGKSSLLRVMAKVYKPTAGKIEVNGNISSLFDVNLGMNPEATGYENIINLAVMRGLSKKDAIAMTPDIEEFTELGEFLNAPIRTYSTGMQMKLAFAVATSGSSDIMLIDEVIGTGDMHFMDKATERLQKTIEASKILVLTSHSTDNIQRFCNKGLVLEEGNLRFFGDVNEAIEFYENSVS